MPEPTPSPAAPTQTYRIGELVARCGRSAHTLRWYEAQGLIPGVGRDAGGRRVYNDSHVSWLELMDRLRCTGMSIAEMQAYASLVSEGDRTLGQRQQLLSAHRERVRQRIADWTEALAAINSKIAFYAEWVDAGQRPPPPLLRAGAAGQPAPTAVAVPDPASRRSRRKA